MSIVLFLIISSSLLIAFSPWMRGQVTKFFERTGITITLKIDSALATNISNYYVAIQVVAFLPNGTEITIYRGVVNDSKIVLDPNNSEAFRKVIRAWVQRLNEEYDKDLAEIALFLSIWIINKNDPRVYYRVVPERVILYNPFRVLKERIKYDISLGSRNLRKYKANVSINLLTDVQLRSNQEKGRYGVKTPTYVVGYEWVLEEYWPQDNEWREIPVMILNNLDTVSADMFSEILIDSRYSTSFDVTLAYGFIIRELARNREYVKIYSDALEVRLGGSSIVRVIDFVEHVHHLLGNQRKYIYIIGKPFYGSYKEYLVAYDSLGKIIYMEPTGNEMIKTYIYDIQSSPTDPSDIAGGVKDGLPPFMDQFFGGVDVRQLFLENGPLADGDLEVEEKESLIDIMNHFDVHKVGFNIGIPVGALIASILPESMAFMGPVLAGLVLSIHYVKEESLHVSGSIENMGKTTFGGRDVTEDVYVAISKYVYHGSMGEFNVPTGIYFVFDTEDLPPNTGCPFLYVYTENGFVREGLLDIHSSSGFDVTRNHTLSNEPVIVDSKYIFKLVEHPKTISYIDYVKLFAVLENSSVVELPLVKAVHNVYGDVLPWLMLDDDLRIPCVGAYHRSFGSHEIYLEFEALNGAKVLYFIFQIQGHNAITKG